MLLLFCSIAICSLTMLLSLRSLFIWRPKEKSKLVEQKVERKIVICDRAEKKQSRKYGNKSDDSDDDKFTSKGKKLKSNKPEWKLTRCSGKVKR